MKLFLALDTNMSLLLTEVARHKYAVIVFFVSYFLMNFVINFKSFMILAFSNVSKIVLFEGEYFSKSSRPSSSLSVEFTEEADLSEVFINMQLFNVSMRAFLHNHNSPFGDEVHLGALFFFLKNVIIHGESLILQ